MSCLLLAVVILKMNLLQIQLADFESGLYGKDVASRQKRIDTSDFSRSLQLHCKVRQFGLRRKMSPLVYCDKQAEARIT